MQPTDSADAERTLLGAYLRSSRHHIVGIVEGLDEADLRRAVLPSGWDSLGLIQHLAIDVERFWFRAVIAGDPAVIESFENAPDAWKVAPETPSASIFDLYRDETALAEGILEHADLDALPAWWPSHFNGLEVQTVREIVLHVIVETSSHSGHLDIVRELIDGRQWLVLD